MQYEETDACKWEEVLPIAPEKDLRVLKFVHEAKCIRETSVQLRKASN